MRGALPWLAEALPPRYDAWPEGMLGRGSQRDATISRCSRMCSGMRGQPGTKMVGEVGVDGDAQDNWTLVCGPRRLITPARAPGLQLQSFHVRGKGTRSCYCLTMYLCCNLQLLQPFPLHLDLSFRCRCCREATRAIVSRWPVILGNQQNT